MRVSLLSVPMSLGAVRRGVDLGPRAILYAGLAARLGERGHTVAMLDPVAVPDLDAAEAGDPKLQYLAPIRAAAEATACQVNAVIAAGGFPIILGGDHSIALGSVGGTARARGPIGLLWLDAHGDFNDAASSPSGHIHGMILAALAGRGDPALAEAAGADAVVDPRHIAIVGARSLDPGEKTRLRAAGVRVFPMDQVDTRGIGAVMEEALRVVGEGTNGVHLSLDLDVVDPSVVTGFGTPVRGGLSYREAHLAAEMVAHTGRLLALDLVEVNPLLDHANATAELATELALSALGDTTY
jgi:arginase